jgi:hypothetical protein
LNRLLAQSPLAGKASEIESQSRDARQFVVHASDSADAAAYFVRFQRDRGWRKISKMNSMATCSSKPWRQ